MSDISKHAQEHAEQAFARLLLKHGVRAVAVSAALSAAELAMAYHKLSQDESATVIQELQAMLDCFTTRVNRN